MLQTFNYIQQLRQYIKLLKGQGKTIGFVPTMGALHDGHASLIKKSKGENDITISSIYVNPTQFNNPSDLVKYPRTVETDKAMLEKAGCDLLFLPNDVEMYPKETQTKLTFGSLETVMEGKFRPGHFAGVGLVVSKLFHIIEPDRAYFGQKDLQQCAVIRQMVKDLFFNLELVICPTQREVDGLAMSSRNKRLTPENREVAPILYKILTDAKKDLMEGKKLERIKSEIEHFFKLRTDIKLEYFEIADAFSLNTIKNLNEHKQAAICIAAYLGEVRLIDNIVFEL